MPETPRPHGDPARAPEVTRSVDDALTRFAALDKSLQSLNQRLTAEVLASRATLILVAGLFAWPVCVGLATNMIFAAAMGVALLIAIATVGLVSRFVLPRRYAALYRRAIKPELQRLVTTHDVSWSLVLARLKVINGERPTLLEVEIRRDHGLGE